MSAAPRYAVYFAPRPDDPLWHFGSAAIGYDAATGAERPIGDTAGIPAAEMVALTEDPRRYGFHATLKPPFRLADGVDEAGLVAGVAAFAAARARFVVPALAVTAIGPFLALTPAAPAPELHGLADAAVADLDAFRAPLTPADRARRLRSPLTPRQIDHLDRWGYPYVFDEFRFHMTLTGRLPPERRQPLAEDLARRYAVVAAPVAVDAVTIFVQPQPDGRFRVLERLAFGGTA